MNTTTLNAYLAMLAAAYIADGAHLTEEQGKTMYLIGERLKRSVLMSDENMSELTIQDVLQHCMETLDEQLKSEGL